MTASAGSGASAVALGLAAAAEDDADGDASAEAEAEAEAASEADAAADAVAAALGVAAGLADCGGATEAGVALQAPASSMTTAPRATIGFSFSVWLLSMICLDARLSMGGPHGSRTWPTSLHRWPAWVPACAAAIVTAPHAPASASGRQDVHDPLDELLRGQRRCRAKPIQLPHGSGCAKDCPGMADPAAEHDALDVVGHDQQVDRPGEATADGLGDLAWPAGRRRRRHGRRRRRSGAVGRGSGRGHRGRPAGAMASRAWRAMPEPETRVSRQPRSPQAQRAPPGSTMTWPISPASPRAPRWSRPWRMTPAETPVPTAR